MSARLRNNLKMIMHSETIKYVNEIDLKNFKKIRNVGKSTIFELENLLPNNFG